MHIVNELIKEYKNGNDEAFDKILEYNLPLVDKCLEKYNEKYNKKYKDDLLQDGYIFLIQEIKRYINGNFNVDFRIHMCRALLRFYDKKISEYKYENEKLIGLNINYLDCCNDIETNYIQRQNEKDMIMDLENIIFRSNCLTFTRKTTLIANLGYINNFSLRCSDIAKIFNCNKAIIRTKNNYAIEKIKEAILYGYDFNNDDLFSYLQTKEEKVRIYLKELSEDELNLLKTVWGENYNEMQNLKYIDFDNDQIITYYEILSKLYLKIINNKVQGETKLKRRGKTKKI